VAWSARRSLQDTPWRSLGQKLGSAGGSLLTLTSAESALELHEALALERRLEERPYATVAAAAGVGYVLGGGLLSGPTRRVLRAGLTAVAVALAVEQLRLVLLGKRGRRR
jgi:hypothetical protein